MSRVVVVGAGIGGLTSALLLARSGHDVVVCERDAADPPTDAETAWTSWPRPGTPQARLGHSFLPGFRRPLGERLEDILSAVHAWGVPVHDQAAAIPPAARLPEDGEMVLTMARRPTFEAALARSAASEPGIQIRRGCPVTGLVAEPPGRTAIPTVTGVQTRTGSIASDTVIVSGGRGVPVARWLAEVGAAALPEEAEGCGFACYTRYFRLRSAAAAAASVVTDPTVHRDSPGLVYEIWAADAGTFAAELIVPVAHRAVHRLKHPEVWMGTAFELPDFRAWIDPAVAEPITPGVDVMGQERNVHRRFVVNGLPLARGLHVIGDARCQTDSIFAWGCANALKAAVAVADAMGEHPRDFDDQAMAVEAAVGDELAGRFAFSRARDRAALGVARTDDPVAPAAALIDEVLWPAADLDPEVFRAVNRWDMQLDPVDSLAGASRIAERARSALERAPAAETDPPLPSPDELAAIVNQACERSGVASA